MVHLKTDEELQIIRESAQILGKAHGEVARLTGKARSKNLSVGQSGGRIYP
jgi:Xaa-Pro aminopeptidase